MISKIHSTLYAARCYYILMPPTPSLDRSETTPPAPAMPERKKSGMGATVGIVIIVILMLFGALYFWGAHLNAQKAQQQLPLIPPDNSAQQ